MSGGCDRMFFVCDWMRIIIGESVVFQRRRLIYGSLHEWKVDIFHLFYIFTYIVLLEFFFVFFVKFEQRSTFVSE